MIKPIQAKVMLSHVKQPDTWFGLKYNMNLYRGCQHQCIYCDSRSECYQVENFSDILYKENAIELLANELARKRVKGTIGTGSMNDPYMPIEAKIQLTRRALELIARFRFPVHIITKSDLVLRDLDLLRRINEVYTAVSFTITTADDQLAKRLEPAASPPSARLRAIKILAENGILTGITMMPILPFIQDNEENITQIVTQAHEHGASYILPSFGVTLRDRQRLYYYNKLDRHFPGLRQRYERQFGNNYFAPANNYEKLKAVFADLCEHYGIEQRIRPYQPQTATQLPLL
ncbi:MAG: radical SAM protein [Ardenticatenaceae bacterium]|nr:radical SAM protein [Ardenticatenaceae bacterium]